MLLKVYFNKIQVPLKDLGLFDYFFFVGKYVIKSARGFIQHILLLNPGNHTEFFLKLHFYTIHLFIKVLNKEF